MINADIQHADGEVLVDGHGIEQRVQVDRLALFESGPLPATYFGSMFLASWYSLPEYCMDVRIQNVVWSNVVPSPNITVFSVINND